MAFIRLFGAGATRFMLSLDSLSLPFVRAHLNCLPALERLIERGSLRLLGSSGDFASESVWPSFCLGAQPGTHDSIILFNGMLGPCRFADQIEDAGRKASTSTRSGLPWLEKASRLPYSMQGKLIIKSKCPAFRL